MKNNKETKRKGLLGIDVDGTLITDEGHISDAVYEALEKAVACGWEFVIASGRTYYAAKTVIDRFPFLRYAILSNGSCIMDVRDTSIVHMEILAPPLVKKVVEVTRQNGAIPALYSADVLNQTVYYDTVENACDFFSWYVSTDKRCVKIDDVLNYTEDILQIGMIAARDIIFAIRDELEGSETKVICLPFESPHFGGKNYDFWFLQIVSKQATKHNALIRVAGWLGIPAGRLIAVGDNYNDADMIRNADVGVAMGNAPDEIKQIAREVVGSNNGSGIVEVIDRFVLDESYFSGI
ncbi:MAG: HAD-IIB family hydrolase [Candidatus Latescibacteria bacterium]|nr:HAD-IIB family hydrolase [Candidatus Latescibacterota bacterium]